MAKRKYTPGEIPLAEAEVAWLAGLLEGEGYFGAWNPTTRQGMHLVIRLGMADKDVVQRAAEFMGGHINGPRKVKSPNHRPMYELTSGGYKAAYVMRRILPLMGERRSKKILECLASWENRPRQQRETGLGTTCHPDRKNKGHGLCNACYQRQRKHDLRTSLVAA